MHTLPTISRSKDNQIMRFGQLIEYSASFKNHVENKAARLVPDLFLCFRKALYELKASALQLSFNILR